MKYEPLGTADNALQRVVFIVEYSRPFTQSEYAAIDEASKSWRQDLPRRSVSNAVLFQPELNRVGVNEQSIASLSYEALMRDGNVEAGIRFEGNSIMYLVGNYTRWNQIWPKAREAISMAMGLIDVGNPVAAYSTEYTDLFRAIDGYEEFDPHRFLREASPLLAPHVYGRSANWHVHTGYFENCAELAPHRILNRVNIDLRDNIDSKSRDLSIVLFHSILGPLGPFETLSQLPDVVRGLGADNFVRLHEIDKSVLIQIVNDEMAQKIGLTR